MGDKAESEVFAYQLDNEGGVREINSTQPDTVGLSWIHGDLSQGDTEKWLKSLEVPPSVIDSLIRLDPRPRCSNINQGTLLIIRALNMNPGQDPEDMVSLRMWIEKDRLITVRNRMIYSVQDIHQELRAGEGPATIHELVLTLIDRIIDRVSEYIDSLEDKIDNVEEEVETSGISDARSDISRLRRHASTIRRYLAPQREALENFHRIPNQVLLESDRHYVQEMSDRIIRYVEDLDLLRERSQFLLEELMNRISMEQNSRMYLLSIVAAIFLPITFISGVFGMNVDGLPWVENPSGFILVSAIMSVIAVAIIGYFLSRKWL